MNRGDTINVEKVGPRADGPDLMVTQTPGVEGHPIIKWGVWVSDVNKAAGLVWVTRHARFETKLAAQWRGRWEAGLLTGWELCASGTGHNFPLVHRDGRTYGFASPPVLLGRMKFGDKCDFSELADLTRATRRNRNGVAILDWFRERAAEAIPCLGLLLDVVLFPVPDPGDRGNYKE